MLVKKLFTDALLPQRATEAASGWDVFAYRFEKIFTESGFFTPSSPMSVTLKTNDRVMIHTGLSVSVPIGCEVQVRPRSGNALNKGLVVVNSPGTIDSDYRGPVCVIIANIGHESQTISIGDKIAQLVVCSVDLSPIVEVTDLNDTSRGSGGFGSTGSR